MINAVQTLTGTVRETGIQGLSAYEVYKKNGGTLSETEWLASLKGEKGDTGETGPQGPAGTSGISLEEVKAITGELENLSTEDKSNLVNAINEVASSGGSSPIYTINYNVEVTFSNNGTISMTDEFKEQLLNMLKDVENKDLHDFIVLFNFQNLSVLVKMYVYNAIKTMYVGCPIDNIKANANSNIYVEIIIKRDSEGNISTINSFIYKFDNTTFLLTTKNNISYTPTGDYHPATKLYVDDLVGDISTVLATLTTVSEVSE